jgi:hypothetical protein
VSRKVAWLWLMLSVALLPGCADPTGQARAVFLLIGPSGLGSETRAAVGAATHVILAHLRSGDFFAVGRIGAPYFRPQDVLTTVRLSRRPTVANGQKRLLQHQLAKLLDDPAAPEPESDITGGLLAAVEFLKKTAAAQRLILIAADLRAGDAGAEDSDFPIQVEGCRVLALEPAARPQASDGDAAGALDDRLGFWQRRIVSGGGSWQTFSGPKQLAQLLAR